MDDPGGAGVPGRGGGHGRRAANRGRPAAGGIGVGCVLSAIGLLLAGLLAYLLFGVIGTNDGAQPHQVVPIGSIAPGFILPALGGGRPVNLDALGRDRHRPVVLNFFASWCVPCRQETPLLASVARTEQRRHSPVQFIGVDVADVPSSAVAFVQQAGVDYPVAVDADLKVTAGLLRPECRAPDLLHRLDADTWSSTSWVPSTDRSSSRTSADHGEAEAAAGG